MHKLYKDVFSKSIMNRATLNVFNIGKNNKLDMQFLAINMISIRKHNICETEHLQHMCCVYLFNVNCNVPDRPQTHC